MIRSAGIHTYQLKMKVLTPTYIGGGNEAGINKSQYFYDSRNKRLHILDERRLIKFLSERQLLKEYASYIRKLPPKSAMYNSDSINIADWYAGLPNYQGDRKDLEACVKYSADVSNIPQSQLNDIDCFIKDLSGFPYIPGSSIKGSIVSAILVCEILRNKGDYLKYWTDIKRELAESRINKRNIQNIYNRIARSILDYNQDIGMRQVPLKGMSGLSISDSNSINRKEMRIMQRVDLVLTEKVRNDIPLYREYLVSPAETNFSLTIDSYKIKRDLGINSIDDVLECLEQQYNLLFGKEGIFRVFGDIDHLIPETDNARGLLFLGGGTGYHAKSILAALAPNRDELLKAGRLLLHKSENPIYNHKNDKIIAPRTLKISEYEGKQLVNGICRIEVQ